MGTKVVWGEDVARAIEAVRPTKISVGYVGRDWHRYIADPANLEAVIVAPVLGTNPRGVRELAQALGNGRDDGWNRLFFLDELHAKLYLGELAAVCGSANLSENGLAGDRLLELASFVDDPILLLDFAQFFAHALDRAKVAYPLCSDKWARLAWLDQESVRRGLFNNDLPPRNPSPRGAFVDDPARLPKFHVLYWETYDDSEYTDQVGALQNLIKEEVELTAKDWIEVGDWVLRWKKTPKNHRVAKHPLEWMAVHAVIPKGFKVRKGDPYSTCAAQLKTVEVSEDQAPFDLSQDVQDAFERSLEDPKIHEALAQPYTTNAKPFSLAVADAAISNLLKRMAQHLTDA
jgi:hypothetical protein